MTPELREHLLAHLAWSPADDVDRLRFLILALCGETGELANLIKKEWRDGTDRRADIVSELADVGNYIHMIALHMGIDLEEAMLEKLIEVEKRPAWEQKKRDNISPA